MVKGVSRRVIVVESPDPRIFEQAIFILPTDGGGVSSRQLVDQAVRIARSYARGQGGARTRWRPPAWRGCWRRFCKWLTRSGLPLFLPLWVLFFLLTWGGRIASAFFFARGGLRREHFSVRFSGHSLWENRENTTRRNQI